MPNDTMPNVHVTARSGNAKTGDIPVTYRPMVTCEPNCPFLPKSVAEEWLRTGKRSTEHMAVGGCYGTGRIFGLAMKYAGTVTVDSVRAKLRKRNPSARFMRDRVVGDILTESGAVDFDYLQNIATVATEIGLVPFGYTHAFRRMTRRDVKRIASMGYVLNASCESHADVALAVDLGMPVVIASDLVTDGEIIAGRRVVTCPAQTHDDTTCASCGLCARPDRKACVRFQIHGGSARMARTAVLAAESA